VVHAEDDLRQPLHPTLRRLWDVVSASGHEVHVELPEPGLAVCATAGLFRVESVSADGHVVATLRLNLTTIDRGAVGAAAHHGFRQFERLGRERRYAEVLGHELGHAVFTLADPARARHLLSLQSRLVGLSRTLRKAKRAERADIRQRMGALSEQIDSLEAPAQAAEAQVWEELLASQASGGPRSASSIRPEPGRGSTRLPIVEVD
jgi:hypothetical protein